MLNRMGRSPLGVFLRSPLGVRTRRVTRVLTCQQTRLHNKLTLRFQDHPHGNWWNGDWKSTRNCHRVLIWENRDMVDGVVGGGAADYILESNGNGALGAFFPNTLAPFGVTGRTDTNKLDEQPYWWPCQIGGYEILESVWWQPAPSTIPAWTIHADGKVTMAALLEYTSWIDSSGNEVVSVTEGRVRLKRSSLMRRV